MRKMLRLTCLSLALLWGLAQSAFADSFCGYDAGLIGTKAIGYIAPYSLKDAVVTPETFACTISAYDDVEDLSAAQTYPCEDFKHMPSQYVDGYKGTEHNPEGFPIAQSDYFALLVFDAKENMAQISLRSGAKKWVEIKPHHKTDFAYHYQGKGIKAKIPGRAPTQSGLYSAPRLDAPDRLRSGFFRARWQDMFETEAFDSFFQHPFYQWLASEGKINIEGRKIEEFANDLGSGFEIIYEVEEIIKDEEGREWLKASEHFLQTLHIYDWDTRPFEDDENFNPSEHVSDPLRTVYFPYREPSGTITMVMVQAGWCD